MVPEDEAASQAETPPAPRRMGVWIALFALVFLALAVQTALFLGADFLPARHIDVSRSGLETMPDGRTRLTLVLEDAISQTDVSYRVVSPTEEADGYVVEVRSQAPRKESAEGEETVTLVIDLPGVDHVTVLDKRWDHPREHPQGHRFERK